MNVRELWTYREAVNQLKKAKERLEEYEAVIYSPGGVRASGMPLDRCHNSPDRMAVIAETHEELLRARDEAKLKATSAYNVLRRFEAGLTEEEQEVFFLRYVKGASVREIEKALHRSESTLKRKNNRIKEKFRKFKN